ncbi:MAG: c-type cytochrome domain-containing protein [Saprospiraceae bacterium]|nr:c-type cytochrome domain-containing protein [Saprospiraceae bacterium]
MRRHSTITDALLLVAFLMAVSVPACKHDPIFSPVDPVDTMKMDTMFPVDTSAVCHPDTLYFRKDVLPIFRSSCGMELCHDAGTRSGGIELTSYETIIASGKVDPFDPDGSKIYELMTETDLSEVMPPSPRGPISDNNIEVIRRWIEQGALNLACPDDTTCIIDEPVSFSTDVFPVIDKYCIGCHSGANPWAGLYLRSYAEIKLIADSGHLLGVINHAPGYPRMPKNIDKLSDCIIEKITLWVNDGAPNN